MFKVEIMEAIGKPVLQVDASQVVIRLPSGEPISVAALFGSNESVLVSNVDDPNFNANLQKIGIEGTVVVEKMKV